MLRHKGVWIVAEQTKGELHPVSLELLGEGRKVADSLGEDLCAVLLGQDIEALVDTLAHYGANKVYLVEHDLLAQYTTDAYTLVLAGLVRKYKPLIVILGATPNGQDLAARFAARLRTSFASDCIELRVNSQAKPEVIRPAYGDKVYTTVVSCSGPPLVVTIRPGIIGLDQPDESLVFTHGDYCLPNIIIEGRELSGVIDWDYAGLADPYADFASCVWSMGYNYGLEETAERWEPYFFMVYGLEDVDVGNLAYYRKLMDLFP